MNIRELKPLFDDDELKAMSREDLTAKCYEVYLDNFVTNPFSIGEKKLKIIEAPSRMPEFKGMHETFAHIASRELKSKQERIFEINRINRIHWIKPILLSEPGKLIKYFRWKDDRGLCRHYYWYLNKDYMVVLKDVSTDVQIVTAFCVDHDEKQKYFEWYKIYEEGKGDCNK